MLLSKKRDFVREMVKDMEMCLWVAKWWSFKMREWEGMNSGVLQWCYRRDFVKDMEKCENVYMAAKWMKFQNNSVGEMGSGSV